MSEVNHPPPPFFPPHFSKADLKTRCIRTVPHYFNFYVKKINLNKAKQKQKNKTNKTKQNKTKRIKKTNNDSQNTSQKTKEN